jgi:hypothetical protein
MGSVDLTAGLEGVDPVPIVLSFVFLTVPGIAFAKGLTRFRRPRPAPVPGVKPGTSPAGGSQATRPARKKKRSLGNWIASVLTVAALLVAGFGLIPLTKAGFGMITGYKYGPAVAFIAAAVILLAKVIAMVRDLGDGKVDHPYLWLTPVPLFALVVWAMPVVWGQITDQASQTGQMIFGGDKKADQSHSKPHKKAHRGDHSGGE